MKKVVILAAGRGRRLDRKSKPKTLVEVCNKPILLHLIDGFCAVGIHDFTIVVGHQKEQVIKEMNSRINGNLRISFVENPNHESSLAWSVLCVQEHIHEPFILSMGDHVFDKEHFHRITTLSKPQNTVTVLVDPHVENADTDDVKVRFGPDGTVEAIGTDLSHFDAVDMGLFVVDPVFFQTLEKVVHQNPNASFSEALQLWADCGKLRYEIANAAGWDDIDTPTDLIRAEMRIREQMRVGALSHVVFASRRVPDAVYNFVVGEPTTTKMVMMRGFFQHPEEFEFIPRESASSPIFLFSDATVTDLYTQKLHSTMRNMGYNAHLITMADGENSKSLSNFVDLTERVLRMGVDERSVFVSVGGGMVCNVCGFVASCIYRGLTLIHLPTSLMAQCDAAISHKQAINGVHGKNMVGSYYSPRMVLIDVDTLHSLPKRLIYDGFAEVIKHALCQDANYVEWLLAFSKDCTDIDFLERVVSRNIQLKCDLIHEDPREQGMGMIMQYGHTLGHPVEHLSGYSLYHGESIAIGMAAAARIARILNVCSEDTVQIHDRLIAKHHLPIRIPSGITLDALMDALRYNKRYTTEGTQMILLSDVGKPWTVKGNYVIPVTNGILREAVEQIIAR